MIEFRLPDVGEGLHEAQIGDWLVNEGDVVKLDQPLLEVETDKSVVELPSPSAGRIVQLAVATGEMAPVGTLLVVIEPLDKPTTAASSQQAATPASAAPPAVGLAGPGERILAAPSVRKLALAKGVDLTAISGSGPAGRILATDVEQASQQQTASSKQPTSGNGQPAVSQPSARVLAAPAVRKLAQELGVDLAQVSGSAEKGRITPADVQQFVTTAATPSEPTTPPPATESTHTLLRGIRRTMAQRMEEAWRTIPHVTNFEEIDATELIALRQLLKETAVSRHVNITYLPIIAKIVLQLLPTFPDFNASLDMTQLAVIHHPTCHLGIATATDDGLLVPVVRHAERLTIFELASQISKLATQARARQLPREALSGSTFTITNFGSFGGSIGTPIINPPEVAILGIGRIANKPIALPDGTLTVRPMLPLALSFDHRLIDGAAAGAFLQHLRHLLEKPQMLLLDLR